MLPVVRSDHVPEAGPLRAAHPVSCAPSTSALASVSPRSSPWHVPEPVDPANPRSSGSTLGHLCGHLRRRQPTYPGDDAARGKGARWGRRPGDFQHFAPTSLRILREPASRRSQPDSAGATSPGSRHLGMLHEALPGYCGNGLLVRPAPVGDPMLRRVLSCEEHDSDARRTWRAGGRCRARISTVRGVWDAPGAPVLWPGLSYLGRGTCAPRQPHDAVGRTPVSTRPGGPGHEPHDEVRSGRQDSPRS
jgi:hypothetical protein